jgi:rhodanese-related sulfurtransferase
LKITMTNSSSLFREIVKILLLSVCLALIYNGFSSRGIPLIRRETQKIAAVDSILFFSSIQDDSMKDVKVIAPLHERALRNPDSMANLYPKIQATPFKIISLAQFKKLLNEKRGVLLDARGTEEFKIGHINGARNIPALNVEQYFEKLVTIPRDTLVIIYCNNPECHLGQMLADFLKVMEFKNLLLYDDGWDGWIEAKMPVDTSFEY